MLSCLENFEKKFTKIFHLVLKFFADSQSAGYLVDKKMMSVISTLEDSHRKNVSQIFIIWRLES